MAGTASTYDDSNDDPFAGNLSGLSSTQQQAETYYQNTGTNINTILPAATTGSTSSAATANQAPSSASAPATSSSNSLGSALSGLLTTGTLKNIINSGLSIVSSSINANTQASNNAAALQIASENLASQQTALQAQQAQASTISAWVWPMVIIVALTGAIIVIVQIVKKHHE